MKQWGDKDSPIHTRLAREKAETVGDDLPDEFKRAWDEFVNQPDLILTVPPIDVFIVIAAVQLAVRHPQFSKVLKERLRQRLYVWERQAGLVTPGIYRWLEKGWDPRYDVGGTAGKAGERAGM